MTTKFDYCLLELVKTAEEQAPPTKDDKPHPYRAAAKVVGKSLLGFGLGQLAGAGVGKVIGGITEHGGGNSADVARKVMPVLGAAAPVLYSMWRSREKKEVQDAVEREHSKSDGRVPGQ